MSTTQTRSPELEQIQDGLLLIARAADQLRRRCATVLGTDRVRVCDLRPNMEIRHELLDGWWDVLDVDHTDPAVNVTMAQYLGEPVDVPFDHSDIVTVKVSS